MRTISLIFSAIVFLEALNFAGAFPDGTAIQLYTCNGSDRQKWQYHSDDKTIRLLADGKCIDIEDYGTSDGSIVWLYTCHTDDKNPAHQNQEWVLGSDETIKSTLSGKCLDVKDQGSSPGAVVQIWDCSGGANQKWTFNATDSTIREVQSGLCLDAGSPLPRPCDIPSNKNLPFCNYQLTFEQRVADLISRIPLNEKIGLFDNTADGVSSLNIPRYEWWSEALHGVAGSPGVNFVGSTPYATSFPQIGLVAASFDTDLFIAMSTAIGNEGRGMHTEGNAGLTFWAPNINIIRDPRWGRGQETPGEDPYLSSVYVSNFVAGLQGTATKYLKVSSCCKHYDAYDLENWQGMDRYHFNAIVTQQDLADTYLPAFKSCVEDGHASGIMCSYNSVNGIPSCANTELLTTYARGKWNFQGYITGDCGAVDCVQNTHHYTSTPDQTCKVVLEAGTDVDCGSFLGNNLLKAIQDGAVTEKDVDTALTHLFMVQFRLGMFDPLSLQPYSKLDASNVNTPAHQRLALQAALEGIVLLKNQENTLPFNKDTIKTIALIGPNGQATTTMQGNYYGNAPYLVSPQEGLNKYVNTTYTKGCDIASNDKSGFQAACNAARLADATVMVMGLDQSQESEGHDRDIISFPGVQDDLITTVTSCSKGPVVVIVMSGGSLDLTGPKNNQKVGAMLWVGYPGQSGGDAIAQTLFGDNNPAGRTVYTFYPANFVNQVSMENMNMRPGTDNPGHTYRFYNGTPVYHFGYGLSYTTFSFKWSTNEKIILDSDYINKFIDVTDNVYSPWSSTPLATVTCIVTNTGNRDGDVSVLAFMIPPNPGKNGNPITYLIGFKRLSALKPGEQRTVTFQTTAHDLTLVDENGIRRTITGEWKVKIEDTEQSIFIQ